MVNFDIYLLHLLNNLPAQWPWLGPVAIFLASYLIFILGAWYVYAFVWHKRGGLRELLALTLGIGGLYAFNEFVGWFVWLRPRPFVTQVVHLLNHNPGLAKSFPSDHASVAFFIAYLLTAHKARWWWAFVLAALVGVGRVMVGVHYPSDVLAGVVVGVTFGALTILAEKHFK